MQNSIAPKKAWGYVRCSHANQVQSGDTLEVQRRMIEAICVLEGWELAGVYSDPAVSGGTAFKARPEGRWLLEGVSKGDVIIATRLDRAFRDTFDALATVRELSERGVDLYLKDLGGLVTSGPVAKLMLTVMVAFAEFERSRIADRITTAKGWQREAGRHLGGGKVRFGYVKVERGGKQYLEPVPELHAEARRVHAMGLSLRAAAAHFAGLGHAVSHNGIKVLLREVAA